jgi:hypothetical protein
MNKYRHILLFTGIALIAFRLMEPPTVCGQNVNRIIDVFICPYEQTDLLVVHQSTFEPVSRTYEQGNLRTSGYNVSQLLVYNLVDGNMVAQKQMGRISIDEYTQILGYSNGVLWAYSLKDEKGFLSLKISDLDTKNFFGLFMVNRDWKHNFFKSGIKELPLNFAFDPVKRKLIFTDTLKNQYAFDPEKYQPQKTTYKYIETFRQRDFFTLNGYIATNKITIENGNANQLKLNGNDALSLVKFPESALVKFGVANEKKEYLKKSIDSNNDTTDILLTNTKGYFFMISNAPEPRAGNVMVTAFELDNNRIKKVWQTVIDGMLYITYKSRAGSPLQKIIETSEPDFSFTYFTVYKDLLIGFYALNYFVIDSNTGKIIWRVKN